MNALATYESTSFSAATVETPVTRKNPFADATMVGAPTFPVRPITLKLLPSHTREDGRFEISEAPGISPEVLSRLEMVLDQINTLLADPPTDDTDLVDSAAAVRALEHVWNAIAGTDDRTEVFPLSDGGLLFRWRNSRGVVEAEFDADGDAIVMIDDTERNDRRAGYASDLWPEAARWLRER